MHDFPRDRMDAVTSKNVSDGAVKFLEGSIHIFNKSVLLYMVGLYLECYKHFMIVQSIEIYPICKNGPQLNSSII